MRARFVLALLFLLPAVASTRAQTTGSLASAAGRQSPYMQAPRPMEILGLSVEGVEEENMKAFVLRSSGLTVGQSITLPGDQSVAEAIRNIYNLRVFSDVKIVEDRRAGDGVFLAIVVTPQPQLADYTFQGIKRKYRKDLQREIPLFKGGTVRPSDLERSKQVIRDFYREKGYMLADVEVEREVTPENTVQLTFKVNHGPRVEVQDIVVHGNDAVSERRVRKKMKKTREHRWWRFWGNARFDRTKYEEDLDRVVQFYNQRGYYDARIVSDSVYLDTSGDKPGLIVDLEVHEGPQYHVRNIDWEGNTLYRDAVLSNALGLEKGDVYNSVQVDQNLYANKRSSDVSSLYMNRGYMLFRVQPEVRVVEGDSLDLHFDVFEGDVFDFGNVTIAGNTKTKDHVIRRELYTIPGETFSRDAIQESLRRLQQLNYFNAESLAGQPGVDIDEENKAVDLSYTLEEVGSDQLELSGTYGRFGLVLMLRFAFNNFSIQDFFKRESWRPLPSGDGQQLSLSLQTNGLAYQSYSLGFTEPWFRGRPTPVGFTMSYSRFTNSSLYYRTSISNGNQKFIRYSGNVFYQRRLKVPDDKFSMSTGFGYQFFNNDNLVSSQILPQGISQEVTVRQSFSRNSLDHPVFPTQGSNMLFSVEVAPPLGNFIQYHKWRFKTDWNVPLAPKLTLSAGTDLGYIGSLTGEDVLFERFVVGGSPFDSQGFRDNFGKDIVYMRGYPARALGPRRGNDAVGGRILNRYTSELRVLAIQTPQLQLAPYLFLDAANTWDTFGTYNPARLFRSGGLGARLFLPILGMIELTYGYNFDEFEPLPGQNHQGNRRWLFQFSIGQGFNN